MAVYVWAWPADQCLCGTCDVDKHQVCVLRSSFWLLFKCEHWSMTSSVETGSYLASRISMEQQVGSNQSMPNWLSSACTSAILAIALNSFSVICNGLRIGSSFSNHIMVPVLYLISMPVLAKNLNLEWHHINSYGQIPMPFVGEPINFCQTLADACLKGQPSPWTHYFLQWCTLVVLSQLQPACSALASTHGVWMFLVPQGQTALSVLFESKLLQWCPLPWCWVGSDFYHFQAKSSFLTS